MTKRRLKIGYILTTPDGFTEKLVKRVIHNKDCVDIWKTKGSDGKPLFSASVYAKGEEHYRYETELKSLPKMVKHVKRYLCM